MCRYSDPAISWNLQGQNFISRTCNPTLFRKHIWCIGECKSRARGRCWNSISVHYICMKPPLKLISFPESFLLDTCCFARKLLLWCTSCYLFHRMTHMTGYYGTSGMTWPDLNDDSCGQAIRWKIFWAFETFGYISISSCHTIVCSICQFWILGMYRGLWKRCTVLPKQVHFLGSKYILREACTSLIEVHSASEWPRT